MNTFGQKLRATIFGASHGEYVGITIDGYPAGVAIDGSLIRKRLDQRRGMTAVTSKRREPDEYKIISGLFNGLTTGAPLTVLVSNRDVDSAPYRENYGIARPSHADYVYYHKYRGHADYRGGGTASGRMTVVLVILGALCEQLLAGKNIIVASRIKEVGGVKDGEFDPKEEALRTLREEAFPAVSSEAREKMLEKIALTAAEGDSLGGIAETYALNLPIGLGEPFFDGVESLIARLVFSVPGVKGVEFGAGFALAGMTGSVANDEMSYENGRVAYHSNNAGGINGGLSNGAPLVFRTAFRPTPSISRPQKTVNFIEKTNVTTSVTGRHDTVIAIKGLHAVNALALYAIAELMAREGAF